jgi:RimJ/RimL family protein N-acetyltransferase
MLRGAKVGLRARHDTDIPILMSEMYDDIPTRSRADTRPWRPIPPGSTASPYANADPTDDTTFFSIVELADGELAGDALLWGLDSHQRSAHLGLALRPSCRGRGLGTDVVQVLCGYGFTVRGLHRLQLEALADNAAMIAAATRAGFTLEGTQRQAAWVTGSYADVVIMGLLASEWTP